MARLQTVTRRRGDRNSGSQRSQSFSYAFIQLQSSGIAPVPDLLDRGINVGLGTDSYTNNFFEVMRGAFLIHKAHRQDPRLMQVSLVFNMATAMRARVLGRADLGTIKKGKLADLVILDGDTPTPLNEHNLLDQLVLYRNPCNVDSVMLNGRFLLEHRCCVTLDEEKVLAETGPQLQNYGGAADGT